MLKDSLPTRVNFGGETVEVPSEMICVVPPNGIKVHIYGIDDNDCREYFDVNMETFRKSKCDLDANTPRLNEYYCCRKEQQSSA